MASKKEEVDSVKKMENGGFLPKSRYAVGRNGLAVIASQSLVPRFRPDDHVLSRNLKIVPEILPIISH
jgi:hypothetical protein